MSQSGEPEETAAEMAARGVLDDTATPYAVDTYLPEPPRRRSGIAVCLSGGGFRAALFHLGALRRLNELGVLSRVNTISSVSGGSIISAHLATSINKWTGSGQVLSGQDWERLVAAPFRAFTARNLRTGPLLRRLLPWNWLRSSTAVEALAERYQQRLTGLMLNELPTRPRFVFCTTDMAFGVNWTFERACSGDYQAGYICPTPGWPVAYAVAASSCFPPIFEPLPLGKLHVRPDQLTRGKIVRGPERDKLISGMRFTDGGVYDNMGLEPVWKTHRSVLVSDGGGVFDFERDSGFLWRLSRYTSIVGRQALALRKRWLISGFLTSEIEGAYWGIGSATAHYGSDAPAGYSPALVESTISRVRTDLDAFSEAERAVLENHGYLLADAAIRQHASQLMAPGAPAARVPHPEWMDEAKVRWALRDSSSLNLPLGRN